MRAAFFGVLVMLGLAAALYFFARKRPPKRANAAALFKQLVIATRDPQVAERLVERQRAAHPNASERELVRRALDELRADMRS